MVDRYQHRRVFEPQIDHHDQVGVNPRLVVLLLAQREIAHLQATVVAMDNSEVPPQLHVLQTLVNARLMVITTIVDTAIVEAISHPVETALNRVETEVLAVIMHPITSTMIKMVMIIIMVTWSRLKIAIIIIKKMIMEMKNRMIIGIRMVSIRLTCSTLVMKIITSMILKIILITTPTVVNMMID